MRNHPIALAAILTVAILGSRSVNAAQQRTFVASTGLDTNACSLAAPCRSFTRALSQTDSGGEVIALDSAGYGSVTINQSVSIIAPDGVYAGITAETGNAITINAGASDVVVLRGLTLKGAGAEKGVLFTGGAALRFQNLVVEGFLGNGIEMNAAADLSVEDTTVAECGNNGVLVRAPSGNARASLYNLRVERNFRGLFVSGRGKATVRGCVASGNGDAGIFVDTLTDVAELSIEGCLVANNDVGIVSQGRVTAVAMVRVSGSTVTNNTIGLSVGSSNSTMETLGNNLVRGNSFNQSGTLTPIQGL